MTTNTLNTFRFRKELGKVLSLRHCAIDAGYCARFEVQFHSKAQYGVSCSWRAARRRCPENGEVRDCLLYCMRVGLVDSCMIRTRDLTAARRIQSHVHSPDACCSENSTSRLQHQVCVCSFRKSVTQFDDRVSTASAAFKPEANRYHLIVGFPCPFAHRALLLRALKGLQVHPC